MNAADRPSTSTAARRRLTLKQRAGLRQRGHGAGTVVTDPATNASHQLSAEETCVLEWLAEATTLDTLCRRYNERFAPRRIEPAAMQRLIGRLHSAGLVEAPGARAAEERWRNARRQRARSRWLAWTQLLAVRLPLGSPNALLEPLGGFTRAVFSPLSAALGATLCALGAVAVFSDIDRFLADAPKLAWLAQPRLLVGVLVVLAVLKTLHEAAHALAARRFDVNVREAGVLLLFFTPCLYCDVSDAWRLPSRRARMLIAAAGVLCEATLAAIAAIVWRLAEPGVASMIAMNTVVVATAGTLLVNLNPLVRFDGYYLLSDWLETPNLAGRGRAAFLSRLTAPFVRSNPRDDERIGFAVYGMLSVGYTLAITGGFVWLVIGLGRVWRVEGPAILLATTIIAGTLAGPLARLVGSLQRPDWSARVRRGRVYLGVLIGMALLAGVAFTPWPYRPLAPVRVAPENSGLVSVVRGGRLVSIVRPGEAVSAGQVIAVLEDPTAEQALLRAQQSLDRRLLAVQSLEALRGFDEQAAAQLPAARAAATAAERLLRDTQTESERLTLRAPHAGVVVPPEFPATADDTRPSCPIGLDDLGRWLEVGSPIARVVDPQQVKLQLRAPPHVAQHLKQGQSVRVAIAGEHGVREAVITRLASRYDRAADQSSAPSAAFSAAPERVATARLVADSPPLLIGGSGVARIDLGYLPVGQQLLGAIGRLFVLPP
ncbi:MAG: HlyD family efflux transporter periplasmic adaptor subunit [Planctomycetota bacterium]